MQAKSFQLCPIFVTLVTVAHQSPLSMAFSKQEQWSGLPCPPPGDLPDSVIEPESLVSPDWQADSLPVVPPGKPLYWVAEENLLSFELS